MKKVADILTRKGAHVISVAYTSPVIDALQVMADKNIGSVVVMKDDVFAGIMTERDYSRKIALKGRSSTDTTAGEIMSTDYPHVSPKDTIETCMQLMSGKNLRYLPVMEEGRLAGIISINDVVTETIQSQEETISELKDYLHANI